MSAPTVTVFISSSLNSFRSEKRYSRSLTIAEFKVWSWGRGPEGRGVGLRGRGTEEMGFPNARGARDKPALLRWGRGSNGAGPEGSSGSREWEWIQGNSSSRGRGQEPRGGS